MFGVLHASAGNSNPNYLLQRQECTKKYVAQTGRMFSTRFKEHMNAMRNKTNTSSDHARLILETDCTHDIIENKMDTIYITHK
jgi:hypothetical protein